MIKNKDFIPELLKKLERQKQQAIEHIEALKKNYELDSGKYVLISKDLAGWKNEIREWQYALIVYQNERVLKLNESLKNKLLQLQKENRFEKVANLWDEIDRLCAIMPRAKNFLNEEDEILNGERELYFLRGWLLGQESIYESKKFQNQESLTLLMAILLKWINQKRISGD